MNEQLQQALAAMLNKTVSGVEAGAAFLQAEIPDVIHQLLMWKLAEAGISIAFSFSLFVALIVVWVKKSGVGAKIKADGCGYGNHKVTLTHDDDGDFSPHFIVTGGVSLFCFIGLVVELHVKTMVAAQILIAPKIYLIEYAASLAK